MPTFAFPAFILTYYFYSFKIVSIHNASRGIIDFHSEALALVANTAGSSSYEQMGFFITFDFMSPLAIENLSNILHRTKFFVVDQLWQIRRKIS